MNIVIFFSSDIFEQDFLLPLSECLMLFSFQLDDNLTVSQVTDIIGVDSPIGTG